MLTDLLPFVAAALLVILFPGPDFALVVRNAAAGGQAGARATVGGILLGNVLLAGVAVLGLTALLRQSETAFLVLKVAGGLYLLWLGIAGLRDWWRLRADEAPDLSAPGPLRAARDGGRARWFRQGLVSTSSNPKLAMFYVALFPQFHVGSLGPTEGSAVLAVVFLVLVALWYFVLQAAVGAVEELLARRRTRRTLAGGSGVALTALSVALLADR